MYDVKCSEHLCHFCSYCGFGSGLCNMCLMPATRKVPLEGEVFAQVCDGSCMKYFAAEEPLPLEVDFREEDSKPLKILALSANAAAFGIEDRKGKVVIHVTRSDCSGVLAVLCCIRYANQQKIMKFSMTRGDFELVMDDSSGSVKELNISKVLTILAEFKVKISQYM